MPTDSNSSSQPNTIKMATSDQQNKENCSLVMIADPSEDSREVLGTLLARHDVRTVEAGNIAEAVELLDQHAPDLLVIDTDNFMNLDSSEIELLQSKTSVRDTPIVVLGTNRPRFILREGTEFVRKPYHYGVLLLKIKGTLDERLAA